MRKLRAVGYKVCRRRVRLPKVWQTCYAAAVIALERPRIRAAMLIGGLGGVRRVVAGPGMPASLRAG